MQRDTCRIRTVSISSSLFSIRALVLVPVLSIGIGIVGVGGIAALASESALRGISPLSVRAGAVPSDPQTLRYSERTLQVGIAFDRESASLVQYSVQPRPFELVGEDPTPRSYRYGKELQLEVRLIGPGGRSFTRRIDAGPLCFDHHSLEPAHITGDQIVKHEEGVLVQLPELSGFDLVEVSWFEEDAGRAQPRILGSFELAPERFDRAGGGLTYPDLAFADDRRLSGSGSGTGTTRSATIRWPEDLGETELYRVYGDESETAERMNIVLVPDGYNFVDKATMEAHADAMVNYLRQKTPYKEHDPFINYILVYAYSLNSGTDQCDCDAILDTAMGTSFPDPVPTCGDSGNRCLYYHSGSCDTYAIGNILAAEARAPGVDETIIMVNTDRYGGCGGARGVYSAGNSAATEIATHELGHSAAGLADEYGGNGSCGAGAGEINTSTDPVDGSWPEWVGLIGSPVEGAQYYDQCIYRPRSNCEMRSLNQPFCEVCNQHWALTWYSFPAIQPTAPIRSFSPPTSIQIPSGTEQTFDLVTRLGIGTDDSITWTLTGPGISPTVISTDRISVPYTFNVEGNYQLTAEVVADTNFIRPERYGANVDSVSWSIDVSCGAAPGPVQPLELSEIGGDTELSWNPVTGADEYALTRGSVGNLASADFGACLDPSWTVTTYMDSEVPAPGEAWTYLLQARSGCGLGSLGSDSQSAERTNGNAAACQ